MKKIIFFLMMGIILINLVSAETDGSILTGKQNNCIDLPQECSSCSYVNVTTITLPDITRLSIQDSMTKEGTSFNYAFCNTTQLGKYSYCTLGDVGGTDTIVCKDFDVTYLGKKMSEGQSILYIGFLALLILIFFLNFIGMGFLPNRNQKDEEGKILSISYLKYFRNVLWMTGYFLFIGIVYVASNLAFAFLEEELLAQTLFMIFKIAFGIAPVILILWIIWIFVSMFHDKQFQKMLNRGIFPQGKI